jgi:serine/threonine-protein kinase
LPDAPELTAIMPDARWFGRVVRAALRHQRVHVPLENVPLGAGEQPLRVRFEGREDLVVMAEVEGDPDDMLYPLRLRPCTRAQAAELYALSEELPGDSVAPDETDMSSQVPVPIFSEIPASPQAGGSDTVVDSVCVVNRTTVDPPSSGALSDMPVGLLARPVSHVTTIAAPPDASVPPPAREPVDPHANRTIAGKYKLISRIGAGGAGAVYRAEHLSLGRDVAVKVLHAQNRGHDQFVRRFKAEARAASLLDHPNVTRVMDFGEEPDGLLYLVMEYVAGQSMEQAILANGKLAQARVVDIGIQACGALIRAHAAKIIHRDIKPENILLVPHVDDDSKEVDLVKVCDFGMAKLKDPNVIGEDITLGGMICGSPAYMSPEQARGLELDPRTDIYSLGITLYEGVTGKLPFTAHTIVELLMKHSEEPPTPPSKLVPGIDPVLEDVILRALAKDPKDRHESARVMRLELRAVAEQLLEALSVDAAISVGTPSSS